MITLLALALALSAECGPMRLATDDCARDARIWAVVRAARAIEWKVATWPEAA